MKASEIRQSFLDFFKKYDHHIVSSAPVVPVDDPTLLFTNAGMNQFKDVFLDTGTRPYTRVADTQKCIRVSGKHNDLEEVGYDTYHHTFFEMLGNWSFGDYYKEEAIVWAWELVTAVWGLPKDRLWATVFREDSEAETIWKKKTDIPASRILRFDEKDNFWEMGETGPCGPCSEIHIDLGEGFCDRQHIQGHVCGVNQCCGRYIELWNLVFIQYNRDNTGVLHPLPKKHVDTGMGFERAVAVLQKKRSNYETDLFVPLIRKIEDMSGKSATDVHLLPAFRVIADHVRALTFAITDGALPSNEGRGYVLRRLLRRAARYGRNLGLMDPFIHTLVPAVIDIMGDAFPEITERQKHTTAVIQSEETRFNEVLDRGIEIFETVAADLMKKGEHVIPGEEAFRLYDTYGFPLDLTQLMAREKGLGVDQDGFDREMGRQQNRAREGQQFRDAAEGEWEEFSGEKKSVYVGEETDDCATDVIKVSYGGDGHADIVLKETPFYAESGGQVGDRGVITGPGFQLRIDNTFRQGDMILHRGRFEKGSTISSPKVEARVDTDRKLSTARNHTATHLLHKALKEVLGDHVNQAGSLVTPERMRFDFTHFAAMTEAQIEQTERIVNLHIIRNHRVEKYHTSLADAREEGATALFGEKYGEEVRVVRIEDYSMELCGGTHLDSTGQIGYFRIVSEEGIAAGVRRIEAVTGTGADQWLREEKRILDRAGVLLKCRRDEIPQRIEALIRERKTNERKIRQMEKSSASSELDILVSKAEKVKGISLVANRVGVSDMDAFRSMGDRLREMLKTGVGVLGTIMEDKAQLLCVVTDDLIKSKGIRAGDIVRELAPIMGGGGGGKPHLALAGGKDTDKLDQAIAASRDVLASKLD